MRRSRTLAAAAAVAVAGTMLLTLSPPQGTERDTATAPVTGPKSDTFNMTATNVPFPASPWPSSGRVANSPRIDVTNASMRHSSWVNIQSTSVKKAVTPDNNNLLSQIALDYEYGEGKCEFLLGPYWNARGVGQITENTTYSRTPQDKVAIATLAPGQKRSLCPAVRLNYTTSTDAGQRDALLNHAGRALDITTVVNQKSELPATWASEPRTAISRYRVNMPRPQKPSDGPICRNTRENGNPNTSSGWGGFFWGWPDADTNHSSQKSTPAMAGGWELFRKSATGDVWKSMHSDVVPGATRHRGGIPGTAISNDGQAASMVRQFKLRGYPFTEANGKPDKLRYVESSWIAEAHMAANNTFYCDNPVSPQEPIPNPNAGPHNMP